MNAYSYLLLNIVVFRISVVSALDVRIETIEDDGTRDVWTFEDSSLKSQLHVCLGLNVKNVDALARL